MACKKDKVPCTTCPVPSGNSNCEDIQNVKHFFYFKVGSWWVYQEENSGDLDTVYVTEAAENPSNYDFDVQVYSTYQDYFYHFWPEYAYLSQNCNDSGPICGSCITVKRSKYKTGEFVGEAKCFFFIPKLGLTDVNWNPTFANNYVSIEQIESSFILDTFNFDRTITINELNTEMENFQPTKHFFSENIGLIRKELLDSNNIWNLIDYHIEL